MKTCDTCQFCGWGFRLGVSYKKCMNVSLPCEELGYICGKYLPMDVDLPEADKTLDVDKLMQDYNSLRDEVEILAPICRRLTNDIEYIRKYVKEQREICCKLLASTPAGDPLQRRIIGQLDAWSDLLLEWEKREACEGKQRK